jgi:DNA polymerase-3 subunit epsilon
MAMDLRHQNSSKLVIIDTETGGIDPLKASILALAAVIWENGEIRDQIELHIKESPIVAEPEALRINRIDLKDLTTYGLVPRAAVEQFEKFLNRSFDPQEEVVLAGHNISFDIAFLKRLYRLAGCDYPKRFSHRTFDTASVLRYLNLGSVIHTTDVSSNTAFAYFNVSPSEEKRHSALADALATAHLITGLVRLLEHRTAAGSR